MADFVAVIRRAVDGLSDNNPEMRSKVYEKARGAVRRQLEAMKPRPSDDLVQRQLDKLEAAIASVEDEHAEALPADEPAPVAAPEPEPAAPAPVEEAPVPVAEPPVPAEPEPVEPEPEAVEAPPPVEPEPVEPEPVEPEYSEPEPVAEMAPPVEPEPEPEPEPVEEAAVEPEPVPPVEAVEPVAEPEPLAEPESGTPVEPPPADDYVPSWQVEEPAEAAPEPEAFAPEPVEAEDPALFAPEPAPQESETPDWLEGAAGLTPESNPDEPAWDWPEEEAAPAETPQEMPAAHGGDWSEIDEILSEPRVSEPAAADVPPAAAAAAAASAAAPSAPPRSFRAEPRKSRVNLPALVALLLFLAAVAGAGAGYWFNRDKVDVWVGDMIASLTGPAAPVATPETPETADPTPAVATETEDAPPPQPVETQPPAEEEEPAATPPVDQGAAGEESGSRTGGEKFTQRLLADGTEVQEGPAAALDGVDGEGRSVAAQSGEAETAAPEETDAGAPDEGAAATTPGTTTEAPAEAAGASAPGAAQKMFLYEERLGQTAPTAIEGTVQWSQAEESPGGDDRPEPVVRAQVNVPSSGLTALVTFRRNTDQSLPASHIIEIVFSLPATFEGGGIESVQRVAMKRTEQDRGDQLIAVPAKITDDFHMIALNDFPEAITRNTELLRTRGWIDIPLTYRNGRRALITLDKGPTGTEVFDAVMKAWAAQGTAGGQ